MIHMFIKRVDGYLYPHLNNSLAGIYREIYAAMGKQHFTYKCLNAGLVGCTGSTLCIPYDLQLWADEQLDQFDAQIEDRRLIIAYLVRAGNRLNYEANMLFLAPAGMACDLPSPRLAEADKETLEELKKMPEYELIQQQSAFVKMGI